MTRTFFQGIDDSDATAFWNITCSNGRSYVVTIAADDTTRVLDCAKYEASGLQRCFVTFKERADQLKQKMVKPEGPPRFSGALPPEVLRTH